MAEDEKNMNVPINITKVTDHPITMPVMWVALIFMAGWLVRPMIRTYMAADFFTKAEAAEHIYNVTEKLENLEETQTVTARVMKAHITEFRAANAFNMVRGLEADLAQHRATPGTSHSWQVTERNLEGKVGLAHEYKVCLMNERPNCDVIQKQIFQ